NFGSDVQLLAQGGATPTNVYLSFDLGSAGRPAILAKLSLRVADGGGGRVSLVGNTTWSEGTITYATAPAIGTGAAEMPQQSRDGTIAANVTSTVDADPDGLLSFALTTTAAGLASYHSD